MSVYVCVYMYNIYIYIQIDLHTCIYVCIYPYRAVANNISWLIYLNTLLGMRCPRPIDILPM